jgi:tRNA-binding EMAP/Myf-like protein
MLMFFNQFTAIPLVMNTETGATPYNLLTAIGSVVGKVVNVNFHPNAQRVRIANVIYSHTGKTSQIIFGGLVDVVTPGVFVPVAPPTKSCRIQGIKMRRRNFRGVASYGELLSLYELGLTKEDTDQVAVFHDKLEIGTPVAALIRDLKAYDELWGIFKKPVNF